MKKLVSIVIPCYNEEEVLPETLFRLLEFTTDFVEYDFELILLMMEVLIEPEKFYLVVHYKIH